MNNSCWCSQTDMKSVKLEVTINEHCILDCICRDDSCHFYFFRSHRKLTLMTYRASIVFFNILFDVDTYLAKATRVRIFNGRRIYPFNKGLRIYGGVYHPPFDTLKKCTFAYDMNMKHYR